MKRAPTALILLCLLAGSGCEKTETIAQSELPVPMVTVAPPVSKPVTYYEKFTGRLESTEQVEVRARVSGYLIKIYFQPGTEVKKGDPLFDIDPEPFLADVAKVQADITRVQARVQRLGFDLARDEKLLKTGAVSKEDYDKTVGDKLEAEATVKSEQARLISAKLNLGYAKITAPIAGVIGDRLITEGNLINGGQAGGGTLLTTIVAVERMDMSFDVDENTLQRIQKSATEGKIKKAKDGNIPVEMGIAVHGTAYPIPGEITFMNNTVDPKTGTLRVKAEFNNPKTPQGPRLLTAGMFARVRVRLSDPVQSLLVPDSALGTDQGTKFLYVVGKENKAQRVTATLGGLEDGMRVIESVQGADDKEPRPLRADELIIVNGLQRVRPGMTVDPKPSAAKSADKSTK